MALIEATTESNLGRKGLVSAFVHHEGKSGQGLKVRTKAEALEEYCLLVCPHGLLSLLFLKKNAIQDHLPRGDTAHSGPGPLSSNINQEIALTDLPTDQYDGGIFLPGVPSFLNDPS